MLCASFISPSSFRGYCTFSDFAECADNISIANAVTVTIQCNKMLLYRTIPFRCIRSTNRIRTLNFIESVKMLLYPYPCLETVVSGFSVKRDRERQKERKTTSTENIKANITIGSTVNVIFLLFFILSMERMR